MGADSFTGATSAVDQRFLGYGGNDTFDGSDGINRGRLSGGREARVRTSGMIIDLGTGTEQARRVAPTLIGRRGYSDLSIARNGPRHGLQRQISRRRPRRPMRSMGTLATMCCGGATAPTRSMAAPASTPSTAAPAMTFLSAGSVSTGDEDWFEGSTGNDTIHGGLDGQNDDPNQTLLERDQLLQERHLGHRGDVRIDGAGGNGFEARRCRHRYFHEHRCRARN